MEELLQQQLADAQVEVDTIYEVCKSKRKLTIGVQYGAGWLVCRCPIARDGSMDHHAA